MPTTPRGRHRAELAPAEHEALRLLRLSVAGLVEREQELVLAIHQLLLVRMPGVTRLRGAGRPIAVRRAGAENRAAGFGPEHEAVVGDVLLQAVRTVHQGTWSGPLRAGWVEYVR